jgi:hypothetical protein
LKRYYKSPGVGHIPTELTQAGGEKRLRSNTRISARVTQLRARESVARRTDCPEHMQRVQQLQLADMRRRLEFCHWINAEFQMMRDILFSDEARFACDGVNSTRYSHLWDHNSPSGTVLSTCRHRVSVNVFRAVIGDRVTGDS